MSEHAFIELIDFMGGDTAVVNAALVRYGRSIPEVDQKHAELLKTVMRRGISEPFEQALMTWYLRCPIFMETDWRNVGSIIKLDRSKVQVRNDYYRPRKLKGDIGKHQDAVLEVLNTAYAAAEESYNELLAMGLSKDHARLVLPTGVFTEFRWTVSALDLMRFIQDGSKHTSPEMVAYARNIEYVWAQEMPATHAAFVANDRVAP